MYLKKIKLNINFPSAPQDKSHENREMLFERKDRAAIWNAVRFESFMNVSATHCSDLVFFDPALYPNLDAFPRRFNVFCGKKVNCYIFTQAFFGYSLFKSYFE